MQLFVRGSERIHTIDVNSDSSIAELKAVLTGLEGLSTEDQLLSIGGRLLENDVSTLLDSGLQNFSTLDLSSRLLGGKVHGSLARAGKVRGQTPKVEPKEKKKKPTGRAKRRLQYTRRFVNVVVAGPGRRRGPNSNVK